MEPTEQATGRRGPQPASDPPDARRRRVSGCSPSGSVYRLALIVSRRCDDRHRRRCGCRHWPSPSLAMWRTVAPLVSKQAELQARYEAALADALRDPLTGLGNHRAFHEELDRQVAAALRYNVPLSLLLIDIDDFKSINDTRGHANRGPGPARIRLADERRAAPCGSRLPRRRRRVRRPLPAYRSRGRPRRCAAPADPGPGADRLVRGGRVPVLLRRSVRFARTRPRPGAAVRAGRCGAVRGQAQRTHGDRVLRALDGQWPIPPAPPCRPWPR